MKNKTIQKIYIITMLVLLFISIYMPISHADTIIRNVTPDQITGQSVGGNLEISFVDKVVDLLTKIGIILAVGVMMILGIKYIMGSLEEKAEYKKTMLPYLIGCFLIFGASVLAPKIIELFKGANSTETFGSIALGLIKVIGTFVAVGALMIIGVKYMLGSTEEKAEYKKSMLPYLIGSILLFGAVNLTSALYNTIALQPDKNGASGVSSAKDYTSNHSVNEIREEYENAKKKYEEAKEKGNEDEIAYWERYTANLEQYLNGNKDVTSIESIKKGDKFYCGNCGGELSTREQHSGKCNDCGVNIKGM